MTSVEDLYAIWSRDSELRERLKQSLEPRETLLLDAALKLGDKDRARAAAGRLFGLRLDAQKLLVLAGQMRTLGMNEEAEAVLARTRRQKGMNVATLATLMAISPGIGERV